MPAPVYNPVPEFTKAVHDPIGLFWKKERMDFNDDHPWPYTQPPQNLDLRAFTIKFEDVTRREIFGGEQESFLTTYIPGNT